MKLIDTNLLDSLSEQAKQSPRLRMNYNLHQDLEAKSQRLLNAMEPGSVFPIHRHKNTAETYILLTGSLKIYFYSNNKELTEIIELNQNKGNFGVDIPAGHWHTIEVLESRTVIFETKDGPYIPLDSDDIMEINK